MMLAGHAFAAQPIGRVENALPDDPVMSALRQAGRRLMGVALFSGIINVLMLAGPLYMLQVYDRVIPSRNVATLVGLSLIVLAVYLAQAYFDALRSRMLARIGTLFDAELQEPIHVALATLPLTGAHPSQTQQPLRDLDQLRTYLSGMGPTAILDIPWMPLFIIVMFMFHPVIGIVAMLGVTAIVAMTLLTEWRSKTAVANATQSSALRQVLADATRRNAEVIRALGMTGRLTSSWSQANENYLRQNMQAMDVYANLGACAKTLRYALQSSMLGIAAYLVVIEQASGGIMIASSILMGRALAPIEVALSSWKQFVAARQGVTRLRTTLKSTRRPAAPAILLPRPRRILAVQNLSVMAPGSDRVLVSEISFSLTAGMGLALLGASGSGKTSLSKAIVGIWPAATGVVRLDGAALDQWTSDHLGRHIGYLPQDVSLLDGSVARNIARFDDNATSETVLAAARIAGAHDMILSLPDGYATNIGEGGTALSAGQRQRVGLARAVYGNPFLVVLDEPNANLDADGEQALTGAIETMKGQGSIVVVISHRPSALAALDMAMVLHDGKLIAFGRRDEVFARVAGKAAQQLKMARPPASAAVAAPLQGVGS